MGLSGFSSEKNKRSMVLKRSQTEDCLLLLYKCNIVRLVNLCKYTVPKRVFYKKNVKKWSKLKKLSS